MKDEKIQSVLNALVEIVLKDCRKGEAPKEVQQEYDKMLESVRNSVLYGESSV